jgi:hypothetical protein
MNDKSLINIMKSLVSELQSTTVELKKISGISDKIDILINENKNSKYNYEYTKSIDSNNNNSEAYMTVDEASDHIASEKFTIEIEEIIKQVAELEKCR